MPMRVDSSALPRAATRTDPFASLNEQQRSAVEHGLHGAAPHPIPGPLLVIAGAGSG